MPQKQISGIQPKQRKGSDACYLNAHSRVPALSKQLTCFRMKQAVYRAKVRMVRKYFKKLRPDRNIFLIELSTRYFSLFQKISYLHYELNMCICSSSHTRKDCFVMIHPLTNSMYKILNCMRY